MKNAKNENNPAFEEQTLSFTYHELRAINKLLGRVNREATLSAEDLHFFSMSPYFISANKKIHKAMMIGFRKDLDRKNIKRLPREVAPVTDSTQDFMLSKHHSIRDAKERFQQLNEDSKQYIRSMDESKLRAYCEMYFAPFIPMEEHISALLDVLKEL